MEEIILIIEDEYNDFQHIKNCVLDLGFNCFPKTEQEFDETLRLLESFCAPQNKGTKVELFKYINDILNKNNVVAILCDLMIRNTNNGVRIIHYIRTIFEKNNEPLYNTIVPIVALTKYYNDEISLKAGRAGAYQSKKFFDLDGLKEFEKKQFQISLEHYIALYKNKIKLEKIIAPIFHEYKNLLLENNSLIESQIHNVELLVKGNHEQTIQILSFLLDSNIRLLSNEKKVNLLDEYEKVLLDIFGKEKFENLKLCKWESFKKSFCDVSKDGGFKEFTTCIYEMLDEAGLLDSIPAGKLIGRFITGLIGILST